MNKIIAALMLMVPLVAMAGGQRPPVQQPPGVINHDKQQQAQGQAQGQAQSVTVNVNPETAGGGGVSTNSAGGAGGLGGSGGMGFSTSSSEGGSSDANATGGASNATGGTGGNSVSNSTSGDSSSSSGGNEQGVYVGGDRHDVAASSAATVFAGYCQVGGSAQMEAGGFSVVNSDQFCDYIRLAAVMREAYEYEIQHHTVCTETIETVADKSAAGANEQTDCKPSEKAVKYLSAYYENLEDAHAMVQLTDETALTDRIAGQLTRPLALIGALIWLL